MACRPIGRARLLKRDTDLDISRSTMDGWVMTVGELLLPIVGVMRKDLFAGSYIQADEIPVGVQMHDKRGKNHQAYLWQYGNTARPVHGVAFDFRMGREGEGPKQFLCQLSIQRSAPNRWGMPGTTASADRR